MNFMTTGNEEREGKITILSEKNDVLGKIEILKQVTETSFCYHLFVNGTPINYWFEYQKEIAFSEFRRLVAVESL